jgi:SAM-dependent methyltransferase
MPLTSHAQACLADDTAFDALYPPDIREVSARFWAPVAVARQAALWLRDAGARRVLDVGSGVGKFALVAAATAPELLVVGVEQRAHLVDHARRAQEALGIPNVRFVVGDATGSSWRGFDGLYFFNSFAENTFDPARRLDDLVELSMARFARDVLRSHAALRAAPVGTAVATFCGSSGRIPCSYELVAAESAASAWLRLWVKRLPDDDGSYFVETEGLVIRHDAAGDATPHDGKHDRV